jgi:hypothetical protein
MADIQVNNADWAGLTAEDQERVMNILNATGLAKSGVAIMPTADATSATAGLGGGVSTALINPCKIGCDLAQAIASAACAALPPPAVPICIAAAAATGGCAEAIHRLLRL